MAYSFEMAEGGDLGRRVRDARIALGMSQDDLAEAAGTTQTTIEKIENGKSTRSRFLPAVFSVLRLPLDDLVANKPTTLGRTAISSATRVPPPVSSARDLPVYSSAEGGPGGTIFSTDPIDYVVRPDPLANVKAGYAMYVVGDSMSPAFEQGDLILINPSLPYRSGDDVLIYRVEDGTYEAAVKRLRRATAEAWQLEQFNPAKNLSLSRKDWPTCHVIIGKYSRR
jgi:phage repressor protein C with HTH and peptisase S24 domain